MRGWTRERLAWFSLLSPRTPDLCRAALRAACRAFPDAVTVSHTHDFRDFLVPHPGPPRPLLWHGDNVVSQGLPASRFAVKRYNATLKLSVSPCIWLAPVPRHLCSRLALPLGRTCQGIMNSFQLTNGSGPGSCAGMEWGPLPRRPAGLLLTESPQE